MEDILKLFGLENVPFENLNEAEKKTAMEAYELRAKSEIDPVKMKEFILAMFFSVAREVSDNLVVKNDEVSYIKDANLKARLRNYLFFYDFLASPERAKQALERMGANMNKVK